MKYESPRLATPNPLEPAKYNGEQVEARLGHRIESSNVCPNLNETIDAKIERVKEKARQQITKVAVDAHAKINALESKRPQ